MVPKFWESPMLPQNPHIAGPVVPVIPATMRSEGGNQQSQPTVS